MHTAALVTSGLLQYYSLTHLESCKKGLPNTVRECNLHFKQEADFLVKYSGFRQKKMFSSQEKGEIVHRL